MKSYSLLPLTIIVLFLSPLVMSGQEETTPSDKIFHSMGWSGLYLELLQTPTTSRQVVRYNGDVYTTYDSEFGIGLATFIYNFRYNLHEASETFAISASAHPALGVTIGTTGGGHLNIPIMLGMEIGAGATYTSPSNMGAYIGIGPDINVFPLIGIEDEAKYIKSFWVQPAIMLGIRYWSKHNRMREINLKFGMGGKNINSNTGTGFSRALHGRIGFMYLLNY